MKKFSLFLIFLQILLIDSFKFVQYDEMFNCDPPNPNDTNYQVN